MGEERKQEGESDGRDADGGEKRHGDRKWGKGTGIRRGDNGKD